MENLKLLAERLYCEADEIAGAILPEPDMHLKELDVIERLCSVHMTICKSVMIHAGESGSDRIGADEHESSDILMDIADELRAAEKYLKRFEDTKDSAFQTIGREELRHAEALIKLARLRTLEHGESEKLGELVSRHQSLSGMLA